MFWKKNESETKKDYSNEKKYKVCIELPECDKIHGTKISICHLFSEIHIVNIYRLKKKGKLDY